MEKKLTIVEKYEATIALLKGEAPEVEFTLEDALAFMADRKEQTIKKNAPKGERKLTPDQIKNEEYKEQILSGLAQLAEPVSTGDFAKKIPEFSGFSSQKLASLFTQLTSEGRAVRETVKGRNLYSLPKAD